MSFDKKALFTFGRFQPPTIGHKILIDFIVNTAAEQGADPFIYVSSKQNIMDKYTKSKKYLTMKSNRYFESTDLNENPLSVDVKVKYLQRMFPDKAQIFINTTESRCTSIFPIVDHMKSQGYTSIIMAVGSDRVESFQRILGPVGVSVISAGDRTIVAATPSNAKAMSGTKMREAAVAGSFEAFKQGVMIGSMTDEDAFSLLNAVRAGLGYEPIVRTEGGRRSRTRRIRILKKKKSRKYRLRLEERT